MLVKASSYRENLPTSNVSVYADVPATDPNAVYIRIAAREGWMSGYLGGKFKPEDPVLYKDAVKAILTMLGIQMMILQEIWSLPAYPSLTIWN